jgi:hypothetical protein
MRKFKLIKEYPASPKLGFIVFERHCGMYHNIETGNMYGSQMIENQPEYWEEVIEKDYEIISYVAKDCDTIIVKGPKTVGIIGNMPEDYWKIHSVKRLSDGEVFTVGDRAKTITSKGSHNIRQFRIRQRCTGTDANGDYTYDGIDAIWIDWEENCGGNWLESTEKLKQRLFLTHDGKDIFVGDRIVWVNKDSLLHGTFTADYGSLFCSNQHAYFLSAVDAENYISRNKVLFITADGVGIKKGDMIHGVYRTSNTISNTVVACNRGLHDTFEAIFSTRAAAENYLVQKSHSLSIEDFWEFVCWGGSNIAKSKRLKRLVKERLGIK